MYVKVFIVPDAKKEFVKEEAPDQYAVAVNAPRERGLANRRMLELLRAYLGESKRVIKIVSGHHSPHKIVLLENNGTARK